MAGAAPGIRRIDPSDGRQGGPILSRAVIHGDVVYLCGVTPDAVGDIRAQTQQVLERIDALLERSGTRRSKLLSAQVWLSDMADFAPFNAVWKAWVDPENPPVRACVRADLVRSCRVEIMVTAAR